MMNLYDEFLSADTGGTFAEYLGIEKPRIDYHRSNGTSLYRYIRDGRYSHRVVGEWRETKKAAKESYKEKLKQYRIFCKALETK